MIKQSNQEGIGAVGGFLALIVVVIIGLAAWVVVDKNKNSDTTNDTSLTTSQTKYANKSAFPAPTSATNSGTGTGNGSTSNGTTTTSGKPGSKTAQKTAVFAELGIQFAVSSDLNDLTYKPNSSGDPVSDADRYAFLSTASLQRLDPSCGKDSLGVVSKTNGNWAKMTNNGTKDADRGQQSTLMAQFDTFFIAYTQPQGSCSSNAAISQKAESLQKSIITALKGAKQI